MLVRVRKHIVFKSATQSQKAVSAYLSFGFAVQNWTSTFTVETEIIIRIKILGAICKIK